MNPKPPRSSNIVLCYTLISLSILCILGTVFAAVILREGIIKRVGKPGNLEGLSDGFRVSSLERRIKSKDTDIEIAKKMNGFSNSEAETSEKVKKLQDEKTELIVQRDALVGKVRANEMRGRSWGEFFEDYNLELFLEGVLPIGLLGLFFLRLQFGGKMPVANPLSLTDFERRCILFFPFAIVVSAFGFFLFVWILSVIY